MTRIYQIKKYILVFLLYGSALFINPFITTDVFEFPKLLAVITGVGVLTLLTLMEGSTTAGITAKLPLRDKWLIFFVALFLGGITLSYLFSLDRSVSLMGRPERFQGFVTTLHYLLLMWCTFRFFKSYPTEKTEGVFQALVLLAVTAALLAVMPYLFPVTFPFYFFTPSFYQDRVFGTFGNPNYLAAFLIGVLPFFVIQKRNIKLFGFVLVIFTLFLTGSRSAWIASLIGFSIWAIMDIVTRKKYIKFICILVCVVLIALGFSAKKYFSEGIPQLNRLSFDTAESTSFGTRLDLWQAGIKLARNYPLSGAGHDMIKGSIEPYLPEHLKANDVFFIDRTHSELIDIASMNGIFSLIGYLGIFGVIIFSALFKFCAQTTSLYFTPALISLISLFLFHAVNFATISSNVMIWFLAGYLSINNSKYRGAVGRGR